MNKLRKNKKKGFTLVEIIVVLVIIAILMAALTPVLIGWIREARNSAMAAEARVGMTAAQGILAEKMAKSDGVATLVTGDQDRFQRIAAGALPGSRYWDITVNANGTVTGVSYARQGAATGIRIQNGNSEVLGDIAIGKSVAGADTLMFTIAADDGGDGD